MGKVKLEYINKLRKTYAKEIITSNNNWYVIGTCENERSKTIYYSIIEELEPKKFIIKKGSLLRKIEDYDKRNNTRSSTLRKLRPIRVSIKTVRTILENTEYDEVIEDFEVTSLSNCNSFTSTNVGSLNIEKGGYVHIIDKEELRYEVSTVKEAEHAITSDKTEEAVVAESANHAAKADEAIKLSDEQKLEIKQQTENIAQQTYEENKRKEQLELEEKLKTFVYKYQTFEDYNDKELEYNKQKLESALTMLSRDKTVYVTGKSRSGKTFLCREIAGKFCNIDTTDFENHAKFAHNLMWIKATMSEEVFIQKFAEFCVHNKNAEKCLIVINEAKKDNLYNLLPMWEKMDADGKKYKDFLQEGLTFECNGVSIEVPKGLCILANVADGQNIDDLEQVLNRFNHNRIDMNDISEDLVDISKFTNIPLKVLSLLSEIQSEIIEETENDSKSFIVVYLLKYDKLNTLKKCLKSIKKDLYLWEDDDRVTELESYISKLEDNSDELQF